MTDRELEALLARHDAAAAKLAAIRRDVDKALIAWGDARGYMVRPSIEHAKRELSAAKLGKAA